MNLVIAVLFAVTAWSSEIHLEAEDAEHVGVFVETTRAGFSGTGYVTGFDDPGDSLRFTFEASRSLYELYIGLAASSTKSYAGEVNGRAFRGTAIIRGGTAFREVRAGEFALRDGTNTVVIGQGSGGYDIDYIRLVPVEVPPPAAPPVQLSDPQATPAAKALINFLAALYGRKILSGQQELREVDFITSVTGREVAVASGDLIEYSPSRWARGARPNKMTGYASAEDYIAWAKEEGKPEGIVSLAWHWNAPTDITGEWWQGFYTEHTTFDFAAALADTTSERYQLILRDIDAIAVQLQKFEDADVPVLWRPLHEAAGGWFWWGARGPEPFVRLWRLLYDRLVHHHGLHNLIWVYTHEPRAADWYPGDEYVDIVSRDVYTDPASLMEGEWAELQELYGDRKLIALSESGTLPDPEAYSLYGIWWSWFSMWSDWPGGSLDYARGMEPAYLSQVFGSEVVLTRDELPDWRTQYATSVAPPVPTPASLDFSVYPNPAVGAAVLAAVLPAPADVRVEVFDVAGRRVRAQSPGFQPSGPHTWPVSVDGLAPGVYVVRLMAGDHRAQRKLVVIR